MALPSTDFPRRAHGGPALLASLLLGVAGPAFAAEHESGRIARLAMSTASLWMAEHHEHEIAEGIEKGDLAEALHEAEELIPWLKGTAWAPALEGPAKDATAAVEALAAELGKKDARAARAALEELKAKLHHLHHELMEVVGEGHGNEHGAP